MPKRYWLIKTEPESYSIQHLADEPQQTTFWNGVRNYQARNSLRDDLHVGDGLLFYHSSADPPAIVGTATVVKAGYPDHTARDPKSKYFDPKATDQNPIWFMVDVKLEKVFDTPLALEQLRDVPAIKEMELLRRGSRLSVQPVKPAEFETVLKLAAGKLKLPAVKERPTKAMVKKPAKKPAVKKPTRPKK